MRTNKKCAVCGIDYYYCTGCIDSGGVQRPYWMGMFHDENCKRIFEIASLYEDGQVDYVEAKSVLDKCDLDKKDRFHRNIQKDIAEIYKKSHPKKVVAAKQEKKGKSAKDEK